MPQRNRLHRGRLEQWVRLGNTLHSDAENWVQRGVKGTLSLWCSIATFGDSSKTGDR